MRDGTKPLDSDDGELRPTPNLLVPEQEEWDNMVAEINQPIAAYNEPDRSDRQSDGPEEGKEEEDPNDFENYVAKWEDEVNKHAEPDSPKESPREVLDSDRFTDIEAMLKHEIVEQSNQVREPTPDVLSES